MKANSFTGVGTFLILIILIGMAALAFASPLNPLKQKLGNSSVSVASTSFTALPTTVEYIGDLTPMVITREHTGGVVIGSGTSKIVITWLDTRDGGCKYQGDYFAGGTVFQQPPTNMIDPCNVTDGLFVLHQMINQIKDLRLLRDNRLLQDLEIIFAKTVGWFGALIP